MPVFPSKIIYTASLIRYEYVIPAEAGIQKKRWIPGQARNDRQLYTYVAMYNYTDIKPVLEAFGTAYLAILEAINKALMKKGWSKKELPKSVDGYRVALQKHFAVHNGKLARELEYLYDTLHIAGYYRGLIHNTNVVKEALKATKEFIDKFK